MTFSRTDGARQTANGIRIFSDEVVRNWPADHLLPAIGNRRPAEALDEAIHRIATRYGIRTAGVVAMQLEYQRANAWQ